MLADIADLTRFLLKCDGVAIVLDRVARGQYPKLNIVDGMVACFSDRELAERLHGATAELVRPLEAQKLGFAGFACVPLRTPDGDPIGRIAALSLLSRSCETEDLEILRRMARLAEAALDTVKQVEPTEAGALLRVREP